MNHSELKNEYKRIRRILPFANADAAVILGSGWSDAFDLAPASVSLSYSKIRLLAGPTIPGHLERLTFCEYIGRRLIVFMGRRHFYEGRGWEPVAFPVYLAARLGCHSVLLTNAAGSLRTRLQPGTFMLIRDHINLMGGNPLLGIHDTFWGPRFTDQSCVYDDQVTEVVLRAARHASLPLSSGVYAAVSGPCYETPAEAAALRKLGADAVGMSTVPEAILAHAAGLQVIAVSFIANITGLSRKTTSHDDVLSATSAARTRMSAILRLIARETFDGR